MDTKASINWGPLLTARGSGCHLLSCTSPRKHLCWGCAGALGKLLVPLSSDTTGRCLSGLFATWYHPGGLSLHDMGGGGRVHLFFCLSFWHWLFFSTWNRKNSTSSRVGIQGGKTGDERPVKSLLLLFCILKENYQPGYFKVGRKQLSGSTFWIVPFD